MGWLAQAWTGVGGVRAGWRVGAFLVLVVVLVFAWVFVTPRGFVLGLMSDGRLGPGFIVFNELAVLVPVAAATAVMTWAEGRSFFSCGLGGARPLRRLLGGAGWGLALIGGLILLLVATGHASLVWGGLGAQSVVWYALAWGAASLLTGLAEELALRGYLLQTLERGLGFWPALVITSVMFGALHMSNTGEGVIGIVAAGMGGAIMALGVRGTGALWWSIGLHSAWDYTENFLAGTPDSGQICVGTLLRLTPHGVSWLSGGATGPEGSIFALALLAAALALAVRAFAHPPAPAV